MAKIEFYNRLFDVKVKDVLKKTSLSVSFNKDKIYLQTQDGEEGCELEHHYEIGCDGSDPREAIIDSFLVGDKTPTNILKELENKLYFKFVKDNE